MELDVAGTKDPQLIRSDWTPMSARNIEGVVAKQVANVLTEDGYLTECWRPDWELDEGGVGHVFQRVFQRDGLSAWHVHLFTRDRLFCASGQLYVVLYDARVASPTHGTVAEYRVGERRPAAISIPPGVYHGIRNVGTTDALLINVVDAAYDYEDPDHYRVPADSADIPYRW